MSTDHGAKVICRTKKGEEALRKNIAERNRLPLHERLLYRKMYEEIVEKESPFVWFLRCKSDRLWQLVEASIRGPIRDGLQEEGAVEGTDYDVVIV